MWAAFQAGIGAVVGVGLSVCVNLAKTEEFEPLDQLSQQPARAGFFSSALLSLPDLASCAVRSTALDSKLFHQRAQRIGLLDAVRIRKS